MEFLFLFIGLGLGFIIAFLFFKSKKEIITDTTMLDSKINELEKENIVLQTNLTNSEKDIIRTQEEKKQIQFQLDDVKEKLSSSEARIAASIEKFKSQDEMNKALKAEMENIHKKYSLEFENIANKILDEKSQKFTDQNKTNLDVILNPLKERLKDFELKVDKAYKEENAERITLKTEIKLLHELNKKISDEANNLAKALKGDNKMQGNWGEHILENIFERSGLIKNQEYKKELNINNEDGSRNRPDFVVFLPDNKHVIVDSKVSLIAYERAVNADNEIERESFLKEHILSIKNHIKGLSEKNYQTAFNLDSPDFVLLFIPIESSFSVAIQADNELFSYAWDKKIVIVSPSTLLATLLTISSIWKQERQSRNTMEIARQAGALYDKFVGFLTDMQKIEGTIEQSQRAYADAINKLQTGRGNIINSIQGIKNLGAKAQKQIPDKFLLNEETSQLTDNVSND